MNDASWDADEQKRWFEKVDAEKEKQALELDFDLISFEAPDVSVASGRNTFSALEMKCFDLTNALTVTKQTFSDQAIWNWMLAKL